MAPKALRKQLVEVLVLSKLDFNDTLYPLPQYLEAKLQGVQRCATSFVNNRYTKMADVARLGWLGKCSYSWQPCKVQHFLLVSFTGHYRFYIFCQGSIFAVTQLSQKTTISHRWLKKLQSKILIWFYCVHFTCVVITSHPLKTFRITENNTQLLYGMKRYICAPSLMVKYFQRKDCRPSFHVVNH